MYGKTGTCGEITSRNYKIIFSSNISLHNKNEKSTREDEMKRNTTTCGVEFSCFRFFSPTDGLPKVVGDEHVFYIWVNPSWNNKKHEVKRSRHLNVREVHGLFNAVIDFFLKKNMVIIIYGVNEIPFWQKKLQSLGI